MRGGEPVQTRGARRRQPGSTGADGHGVRVASALRMARAGIHLAERVAAARRLRRVRRRTAILDARRAGRRPQGVPVRRGAQGCAQALGMQGFRYGLYPGDTDRHLHGVTRGSLRGLLQLRPHASRCREVGGIPRAGMTLAALPRDDRGPEMFARYAYAPNALGFCGPPLGATLRDGSVDDVRSAATRFSGAWPYLRVLSALTGIDDPLDYRLVESYWLGGGVGAGLDADEFFREFLAVIGPQAGRYWSHLTDDLAAEAATNHCSHVFGVYPWTRFLGRGMDEHPLNVLDNCRITWGTVVSRAGDEVEVTCRELVS